MAYSELKLEQHGGDGVFDVPGHEARRQRPLGAPVRTFTGYSKTYRMEVMVSKFGDDFRPSTGTDRYLVGWQFLARLEG